MQPDLFEKAAEPPHEFSDWELMGLWMLGEIGDEECPLYRDGA